MFEEQLEYTVKTCPISEPEDLEALLNKMAGEGWNLYLLSEAESDEGDLVYNCVFHRKAEEQIKEESDIIDIGDFKSRVEKIFKGGGEPYEACIEIQKRISEKKSRINDIKNLLEDTESEESRESLNEEISKEMKELHKLKTELSQHIDPDRMYRFVGQDKLLVLLSDELLSLVQNEKELLSQTVKLRQKLVSELGYVIPSVRFTGSDELSENEYRICVRGVVRASGFVYFDHVMYYPEQLNTVKKPKGAIESQDPISQEKVFWLKKDKTKDYWEKGLVPAEAIAETLEGVVLEYVDEILDYEDINHYIEIVGAKNFYLIEGLLTEYLTIGDVRSIFAALIREKVPIKDIVYVFEKMNDIAYKGIEKEILIANIRVLLRNEIFKNLSIDNGKIYGIELLKNAEPVLIKELQKKNSKKIAIIKKEVEKLQKENSNFVLLASVKIRRSLFYALGGIITVLSPEEIPEEIDFTAIKKISKKDLI